MTHLILGDCLQKLKEMPDNTVDSIVTDPPYGLSFMGKAWDYDVPSSDIWKECLRVLKPGGHLLAFFGTRTYHRGVVKIEDAGFEIRDQIMWIYGSGFPKSTDVSKRIDKEAGAEREVVGKSHDKRYSPDGVTSGASIGGTQGGHNFRSQFDLTKPSLPEAIQWQGWGTALKPATEPICVARKPLEKGLTVAANVLKWGTGALNIDGSRIASDSIPKKCTNQNIRGNAFKSDNSERERDTQYNPNPEGRWPANVLLDEAAAEVLDLQSALQGLGRSAGGGDTEAKENSGNWFGKNAKAVMGVNNYNDKGGASRFFYVAKASKRERNAGMGDEINGHPTVKPLKLMSYLINLVTTPNGTVLDPFMGSGSTGVAAAQGGFGFVGIELSPEYHEIAKRRIASATEVPSESPEIDEQINFDL